MAKSREERKRKEGEVRGREGEGRQASVTSNDEDNNNNNGGTTTVTAEGSRMRKKHNKLDPGKAQEKACYNLIQRPWNGRRDCLFSGFLGFVGQNDWNAASVPGSIRCLACCTE